MLQCKYNLLRFWDRLRNGALWKQSTLENQKQPYLRHKMADLRNPLFCAERLLCK